MKKNYQKAMQLLVSFLVAALLFLYATTTHYKMTLANSQSQSNETYTHTISNVPIEIRYDSNKYFISGFSSTASVDLIGSNRLILQKETDEATRSFSIVGDLTTLQEGVDVAQVELQVQGLPTGVNAVVSPFSIQVKIGRRVNRSFPVVGVITQSQLASGYSVGKIRVDVTSVKVTTDEETMSRIDHIEAVVADISELSSDYTGRATLQAVDSQGNILPAVFSDDVTGIQATIVKNK